MILRTLAESAQPATGHANIRGIDVPIHIEVSHVAMQTLAHQVRHVAERENVGGPIQRNAVIVRQTLTPLDLFENRLQLRIFNVYLHSYARCTSSTSAAQNTKNSTLTQPFMVKKAALTRDKSSGFTRLCS